MPDGTLSKQLDIPELGGTLVAKKMPGGCLSFKNISYEWHIEGVICGPDRRHKDASFIIFQQDVNWYLELLLKVISRMVELKKFTGEDSYVENIGYDKEIVLIGTNVFFRMWFYSGASYKYPRLLDRDQCKKFHRILKRVRDIDGPKLSARLKHIDEQASDQ